MILTSSKTRARLELRGQAPRDRISDRGDQPGHASHVHPVFDRPIRRQGGDEERRESARHCGTRPRRPATMQRCAVVKTAKAATSAPTTAMSALFMALPPQRARCPRIPRPRRDRLRPPRLRSLMSLARPAKSHRPPLLPTLHPPRGTSSRIRAVEAQGLSRPCDPATPHRHKGAGSPPSGGSSSRYRRSPPVACRVPAPFFPAPSSPLSIPKNRRPKP